MDQKNTSSKPKYKVWEPLLLSFMVIIGMIAGQKMNNSGSNGYLLKSNSEKSLSGERIEELVRFVESKYVDEIDSDELVQKAIQAVIGELDPHSAYISPGQLADLEEKMQGNFEGIGIEFHILEDTIVVLSLSKGGPAEKAGLHRGDRIVSANDSIIAGRGIALMDLVEDLRGKKGSKIILGISRKNEKEILDFELIRDRIPIHSVSAGFMLDDESGYIKIDRFSSNTYKEFMDELEKMVRDENMQNLIIDVRHNPGGYLQEAVNILSQLFDQRNELLVYTEGAHSKRTEYKSTGKRFFPIDKIAVLIDEGSASASEIVAGAIQDHDRGIVLGMPSFGKGLVQEQYNLSNGGALRLTIARYYTPSGRLVQRPYDVKLDPGHEEYFNQSGTTMDTTPYFTTSGRTVYAEGGISPDLQVQNSADWNSPSSASLYSKLVEFAVRYTDRQNEEAPDNLEQYLASLPKDEVLREEFLAYCAGKWENSVAEIVDSYSSNELSNSVRTMLASYQFGRESGFKVWNESDAVVQKALEVLRNEGLYTEELQ